LRCPSTTKSKKARREKSQEYNSWSFRYQKKKGLVTISVSGKFRSNPMVVKPEGEGGKLARAGIWEGATGGRGNNSGIKYAIGPNPLIPSWGWMQQGVVVKEKGKKTQGCRIDNLTGQLISRENIFSLE